MIGAPASIYQRFDSAVDTWDLHMFRCSDCLTTGTSLCYEGGYLTYAVAELRDEIVAVEAAPRGPSRTPLPRPRRRNHTAAAPIA